MHTRLHKADFSTLALAAVLTAQPVAAATGDPEDGDWPSYNRTLTSDRYSPLSELTPASVGRLKAVCSYDTGQETSFQTGPIVVGGILYATTEFDTFAIDAATCREKWRVHEEYKAAGELKVNRGLAYLEGRLFRGTQDGRVLAYTASTGQRVWEARIADPEKGETVPAAPVAWSGMVFVGNAGGDNFDVQGRIYALDAMTGRVAWEFYLVPRKASDQGASGTAGHDIGQDKARPTWTNPDDVPIGGGATWVSYSIDPERGLLYVPGGNPAPDFLPSLRPGTNLYTDAVVVIDATSGAYRRHFQLVERDFHDWDVSTAPALIKTRGGVRLLAEAPKDGYLHAYDLDSGKRLFRVATTTMSNAQAPLQAGGTRVCPGTQGGSEWNGVAFNPSTNLLYVGSIDWCSTLKPGNPSSFRTGTHGKPWSGSADAQHPFGTMDPKERWGGWLTAFDADKGTVKWRHRAKTPVVSGVTPTAGGLVFFGDLDGGVFALDAGNGKPAWSGRVDGAVGGGVVSYRAGSRQRIAVAAGMTSSLWPTPKTTAKLVVFALE